MEGFHWRSRLMEAPAKVSSSISLPASKSVPICSQTQEEVGWLSFLTGCLWTQLGEGWWFFGLQRVPSSFHFLLSLGNFIYSHASEALRIGDSCICFSTSNFFSDLASSPNWIASCLLDISTWMSQKIFKVNMLKIEILIPIFPLAFPDLLSFCPRP